MKHNVEVSRLLGTREPRRGELNFELKRILTTHCIKASLKKSIKAVELAVSLLAKTYGFDEYECKYDRHTSLDCSKPWITESVQVIIFRRRSNGTLSIYRAGASSCPRSFARSTRYANLSAPRDINIYYGVDEPYTWKAHISPKKIPARIEAKERRYAHS